MGLWKFVEIVGCLLDRAERDTVLGDIQERGVNIRTVFDLIGLVAFRQLQAWKSWRTWLLAASLGIPAVTVASGAQVIAYTMSYYPWPDLAESSRAYFLGLIACRIAAIVGLAWATGFSIASLARYRAISILVLMAFIMMWQQISFTSLALLGGVPALLGSARGWRGDPLDLKAVLGLAILCLPAFAVPNATTWIAWTLTAVAFWPSYYAITRLFGVRERSAIFVSRPKAFAGEDD